jgi:hypothetical protein
MRHLCNPSSHHQTTQLGNDYLKHTNNMLPAYKAGFLNFHHKTVDLHVTALPNLFFAMLNFLFAISQFKVCPVGRSWKIYNIFFTNLSSLFINLTTCEVHLWWIVKSVKIIQSAPQNQAWILYFRSLSSSPHNHQILLLESGSEIVQ